MPPEELWDAISAHLVERLESKRALSNFARQRAKFEGWLKVELIDILNSYDLDALPEQDLIDIVFNGWALELKNVPTNYHFEGVRNVIRPIHDSVNSILRDIQTLSDGIEQNEGQAAVLFVVYPVQQDNARWQVHLNRIEEGLGHHLFCRNFQFIGGIPGALYFGVL